MKEQDFMAATQATFKLGISFENWKDAGEKYFHSFGTTGTDHWTAGFQHFWLKDRERGSKIDYGDYCLELVAAREGKFGHLPKQGLNYAFHLDATLFAKLLRQFGEKLGVRRIEGKIQAIDTHPENGFVQSLKMDFGAC
jgi:tryptophan halogenase